MAAPTGVIGEAAMAQLADELRALGFDVYRVHADSLYFLVDSLEQAYRLHVAIVEASEQTVKANLEKARYNLQKNIDKNNKSLKNEQFV